MADFTKFDNVIDSRDIIARLEELKDERESLADDVETSEENVKFHHNGELDESLDYPEHNEWRDARNALSEWDEENAEELGILEAVNDEGEGYGDWRHGETLIHESYFTEYAQELVSDIGDMPREIPSYIVIDWEATAENLKADYMTVDFDGETFYMRSC